MNTDKNNLEELFNGFKGQWDTEEPELGHQERFLKKLGTKKRKKTINFRLSIPVAAAILILFGLFITFSNDIFQGEEMAEISPEVKETQIYFTSIIEKELAKVEKEDTPETRVLIKDALVSMEELEKDYEKLTAELLKNGENKKIIHAMITNLQTRIRFLEEVMANIENIKKLKEQHHENKTI
jgi:uncharacterized protein YsxB (DUF464 family)